MGSGQSQNKSMSSPELGNKQNLAQNTVSTPVNDKKNKFSSNKTT